VTEFDRQDIAALQTLRPSSYILAVPVPEQDEVFLIHGYTGAMDIVDRSVFDLLKAATSDSQIEGLAGAMEWQDLAHLFKRGYLVHETAVQEHEYFKQIAAGIHEVKRRRAANTFWVIPSYQCNLRCYYCFQSHKLHAGLGPFSTVMDKSRVEDMFTAFKCLGGAHPVQGSRSARYVTLFGGEPLMPATRSIVELIVRRAINEGYKVGAVTNGVELAEFIDLLGPESIRWIQITLDGPREEHDRRRQRASPGSNFDRVVRNISLAIEKGVTVSLRTNADAALIESLDTLEALAVRHGWTASQRFYWHAAPMEAHMSTGNGLNRQSTFPEVLYDNVTSRKLCTIRPPYRDDVIAQLDSLMAGPINRFARTSSCGAHTGMWFFDPLGDIYACAEHAGRREYAVGRFDNRGPTIPEANMSAWYGRHVGTVDACSQCGYALFCGGGCANAALQESGTMMSPRCFGIQQVFDKCALSFRESLGSEASNANAGSHVRPVNQDAQVRARLSTEEYVQAYEAECP
jgi:uncharacterized protein